MKLLFWKVSNKVIFFFKIFIESINIFDNKIINNLDNIFKIKKNKNKYKNIILFDHFNSPNHQLIRLILLRSLSKHYEANLVCFNYTISPFLNKLYKIINVIRLIKNKHVEKKYDINIDQIFKKELKKISSKKRLLNYYFKGYDNSNRK